MSWWQWTALSAGWEAAHDDGVEPPTPEDYYADLDALRARNDPRIKV